MAWSHKDSRAVELFWKAMQRLREDPVLQLLGFDYSSEYCMRQSGCRFDARLWKGISPQEKTIPMSLTSFAEIHGTQHFTDEDVMSRDVEKAMFALRMERPFWVRSDFEVYRLAEEGHLVSSLRAFILGKLETRKVLYCSRDGAPMYCCGNRVCYYSAAGTFVTLRSKADVTWFHERWDAPNTYKENPFYRVLRG